MATCRVFVAVSPDATSSTLVSSDTTLMVGASAFTVDRIFTHDDSAPAVWSALLEDADTTVAAVGSLDAASHRAYVVGPGAEAFHQELFRCAVADMDSSGRGCVGMSPASNDSPALASSSRGVAFSPLLGSHAPEALDQAAPMTVVVGRSGCVVRMHRVAASVAATLAAGDRHSTIIVCVAPSPSSASEPPFDQSAEWALREALAARAVSIATGAIAAPVLVQEAQDLRAALTAADEERELLNEHVDTLEKLVERAKLTIAEATRRAEAAEGHAARLQETLAKEQVHRNDFVKESNHTADEALARHTARCEELTTQVAALERTVAEAKAEQVAAVERAAKFRANELHLVAEFQGRERLWQDELLELITAKQVLEGELARAQSIAARQQAMMSRVAEANQRAREHEAEAISQVTAKLKSLSPERQSSSSRAASTRLASLLSPAMDYPPADGSESEYAVVADTAAVPHHARVLDF